MSQQYEDRMGTDKMLPLIFRMAIPVIAAQLVNLLYNMVDRIYIGRIPGYGTDALAGIGITGSIIILISAFSSIVSGGGAPLAAIALGSGDRKRAGKILGNGFVLLLFFAAITSTIAFIFMEPILRAIGASDNIIGYSIDYLKIYLAGTVFVQLATGLNPFINCQGRPGIGMCSVLIGAISNIILDPIFIYGFHWGVSGAAFATILSQMLSALWVVSFLCSKNASLRIEKKNLKPDLKIIGSMAALGISPFVMASTESLVGFVLNNRLVQYGDIYVSTLTVLQSAMQMISVPCVGFTQGFVPVISYNYGHKNAKRVKEACKIAISVMVSFMILAVAVLVLLRRPVAGLFTDDEALIAEVCRAMPIFMAGMTIFGLQRACQNIFVAMGQAKISLFIALLRKVFLLVPLSFLFSELLGVTGVYLAEAVADATAAILCTVIFAFTIKKLLKGM